MHEQPTQAHLTVSGERVGDYELIGEIARGGMGVVFRATQPALNRVVAFKMILGTGDDGIERFRREAEAVAMLDHPNIVPVYEVGVQDGRPFLAMKLIDGPDLGRAMKEERPGLRTLVEILRTVAAAMAYAHQRGIIHRDLKPANIILDAAGTPFVTDFGLARRVEGGALLTQSNAIVGTPAYMAPEQARGKAGDITTLTDVYALGAILYEMLSGRPPFEGSTPLETALAVLEREPTPPGGDVGLAAVSLKCLAKDPARRYESAAALAEELRRWLAGEPLVVRPPGALTRFGLWIRRNVRAALLVAVVGVVCGGVASAWVLGVACGGYLRDAAAAFDAMPAEPRPPLMDVLVRATDLPALHPAARLAGELIFRLCFCFIGFAAVLAAKPPDVSAATRLGLGVGILAALMGYFLVIGPYVHYQMLMRGSFQDLDSLTLGTLAPTAGFQLSPERIVSPRERLEQLHPDLAVPDAPDDPRSRIAKAERLRDRLVAGQAELAFRATWLGLAAAAYTAVIPIVGQTLLAYFLLRRASGPVYLPYAECSAFTGWLWAAQVGGLFLGPMLYGQQSDGLSGNCVLFLGSLSALALVGAAWGWSWPLRYAGYATAVTLLAALGLARWDNDFDRFSLQAVSDGAAWLLVAGASSAFLALLWVHKGRRTT